MIGRKCRKKRCWTGLLCLLVISAFASPSRALKVKSALSQYLHDSWGTEEGLTQLSITAIQQTRDGYLWVGTQAGLMRFDGVSFQTYQTSQLVKRPIDEVTSLAATPDGSLWIGTFGGGLIHYRSGKFKVFGVQEGLTDLRVKSLFANPDGSLWIGTHDSGLYHLQNGRISSQSQSVKLSGKRINRVYVDSSGRLWIATNAGLNLVESGEVRTFTKADGLASSQVHDITEAKSGGLWFATEEGVSFYRDNTWISLGSKEGLDDLRVHAVVEDDEGNLWVGTEGGGLKVYRDRQFQSYRSDDMRGKTLVSTLKIDAEKNLWVGTKGDGIMMLRDGLVTTFSKSEGLSSEMALGIIQDDQGNIWVGGMSGLTRITNGQAFVYTTKHGLPSDFVLSLYLDPSGDIWAGTRNAGLARVRYQPHSVKENVPSEEKQAESEPPQVAMTRDDFVFSVEEILSTANGLSNNAIYSVFRDSSGKLWVGTNGGGLNVLQNKKTHTLTQNEGLTDNKVISITEDSAGNVWVGTDSGLNKFEAGQLNKHSIHQKFDGVRVMCLYEDSGGRLMVGTYGRGLFVMDGNQTRSIRKRDGLFDDVVFVILEDEQGGYWFSCNMGIFRVSVADLEDFLAGKTDSVKHLSFGSTDGMKKPEATGSFKQPGCIANNGHVWFSTVDGACWIDPKDLNQKGMPPPIIVENVRADGKRVEPGAHLPPGVQTLEFAFTGLSFVSSKHIEFIYRLDGLNDDWLSSGTRRTVNYSNLPPGDYVFRVKARSRSGAWSEKAASFHFVAEPFFYETTWFFALMVTSLSLLVYGGFRLRLHRIKKRNLELEQIVEERTESLKQAHRKILRLEKETTERQMAGGFAHEIRNALVAANLILKKILNQDKSGQSIGATNNEILLNLFKSLKRKLDGDSLKDIVPAIKTLNENERRMGDLVGRVNGSIQRSLTVTEKILLYSEVGKQRPGSEEVDLSELFAQVTKAFEEIFIEHEITCTISITSPIHLRGDSQHLSTIFSNLIRNADEALQLRTDRPSSPKTISVTAEKNRDQCIIAIRDNGLGIDKEDLGRIFDPFFSTNPSSGMGIGLSIVNKYLTMYGASMQFNSVQGQGTTVTVLFPLDSSQGEFT